MRCAGCCSVRFVGAFISYIRALEFWVVVVTVVRDLFELFRLPFCNRVMEGMLTNMERSELEMGIHDGLQEGSDSSVGDYSGDKEQSSQDVSLGDLPEHCIAAILSCLSPREVSRVACVCRSFRAASNFDSVWERILPPKYKDLLALDPEIDPTQFASKKEVFDHLCNFPLVFEKKTQVSICSSINHLQCPS